MIDAVLNEVSSDLKNDERLVLMRLKLVMIKLDKNEKNEK